MAASADSEHRLFGIRSDRRRLLGRSAGSDHGDRLVSLPVHGRLQKGLIQYVGVGKLYSMGDWLWSDAVNHDGLL